MKYTLLQMEQQVQNMRLQPHHTATISFSQALFWEHLLSEQLFFGVIHQNSESVISELK